MEIQDLDDLTVSQLTVLFNTMQDTDEKPIKAFRSRKQAVDRIAALDRLAYWDARLTDDGGVEFDHYPNGSPLNPVPVEVSDGEPDGQTETVDALEDAAQAVEDGYAFVKATKEELGAMDATQRAAYRRRRRAAARAARRLRAGS